MPERYPAALVAGSTFLTLVVVPAVYSLIDGLGVTLRTVEIPWAVPLVQAPIRRALRRS